MWRYLGAGPASPGCPMAQEGVSPPWSSDKLAGLVQRDGCLVALVMAGLLVVFTNCEHIEANSGLGNDGYVYALLARDFHQKVFVQHLDNYAIQRISIPALLYYSSRLLHFELTNKTILRLWRGLDLVCLALAAWLWCKIARELGIGLRGKWFGAILMFGNFAILKWSPYYSNLTDIPAYLLGTAMLYTYLTGRSWALAILTLVAAFTWPTALYQGVLLLFFPRDRDQQPSLPGAPWRLHWLIAIGIGAAIYLMLHHLARSGGIYFPNGYVIPANPAFLNLGIAISATWAVAGLCWLLNDGRLFSLRYLAGRLRYPSLWLGVLVVALARFIQGQLSVGSPTPTQKKMLAHMLWTSVLNPGVFLVTHVLFYGVAFLLAVLLWKPICELLRQYGAGLVLVAAATVLLSLASESRGLMNQLPVFIPFVVLATERFGWRPAQYGFLALLNLVGSKVWLTINPDMFNNLLRMNIGPWISPGSYAIHGALILGSAWVLRSFLVSREPARAQVASTE